MIFDLRPHHVARALAVLCFLPVFYTFAVQGVTTTTTLDYSTGDVSSSSDLGSQIASVAVWIVLAVLFAGAQWYLKNNDTPWPRAAQEFLHRLNLAPAAPTVEPHDDSSGQCR